MKNYHLKNLSKKRIFSMMMISALCTAYPSSSFADVSEVQITMQTVALKGQVVTESGEPVIGGQCHAERYIQRHYNGSGR